MAAVSAPEPGGYELQRALEQQAQTMRDGFAGINSRLDKLVSTDAFLGERGRVDDRIKDLADDISAEREQRAADISGERAARVKGDEDQQRAIEKITATQRWVAAAIILPIALFVATLYMNARGGS